MISSMSFNVFIILYLFYLIPNAHGQPRRPNIYRWLAQNSYICDPTLLNHRSHRFLTSRESHRLRCSCGDPLITKAACGKKSGKEKPRCFRLPDPCLHEYTVIFASGGNRMSKPLHKPQKLPKPHPKPIFKFAAIKRRPPLPPHTFFQAPRRTTIPPRRPHRTPKVVSTFPVATVLRVRKVKKQP